MKHETWFMAGQYASCRKWAKCNAYLRHCPEIISTLVVIALVFNCGISNYTSCFSSIKDNLDL